MKFVNGAINQQQRMPYMPYIYISWNSKICICVFVYFVLVRLTLGNIIFQILEQSSFQKYITCWVFLALRRMLYLCICVFVFVYLCRRHLVISVLISLDQELSENVWFVWSKTPYSGDVTMRDGRRRTREDRATQPLDAGRLSFAKIFFLPKAMN